MIHQQPMIIFDGDCGFCQRCIQSLKNHIHKPLTYIAYQQLQEPIAGLTPQDFKKSIYYQEQNGTLTHGAAALYKVLSDHGSIHWLYWPHRHIPGFAAISEWIYKIIAKNRGRLSKWFNRSSSCQM